MRTQRRPTTSAESLARLERPRQFTHFTIALTVKVSPSHQRKVNQFILILPLVAIKNKYIVVRNIGKRERTYAEGLRSGSPNVEWIGNTTNNNNVAISALHRFVFVSVFHRRSVYTFFLLEHASLRIDKIKLLTRDR